MRVALSRRWVQAVLGTIVAVAIGSAAFAARNWSSFAAQGSDLLRLVVGDRVVAALEGDFYSAVDRWHQWEQAIKPAAPKSPWISLPSESSPAPSSPSDGGGHIAQRIGPSARPWRPTDLTPLMAASGEGQWAPMTVDSSGNPIIERTFLHPDAQRPYAYAAIVAFDLHATRLHFLLGFEEPASTALVSRPGKIPPTDFQPGVLLAAFNGGFKARHGHFGTMVDSVTVIPPRSDLGTVAFYADGRVALGAWGTDILPSPDLVAWRQNGPLLIRGGVAADPATTDTPAVWGQIMGGKTATWRSGLGLSADGRTLYYVAGPSLTLGSLTQALLSAGAANAIQLDMNNYWVHFDSFQAPAGRLVPQPLTPQMGGEGDKRFLDRYARDFFYVTIAQ